MCIYEDIHYGYNHGITTICNSLSLDMLYMYVGGDISRSLHVSHGQIFISPVTLRDLIISQRFGLDCIEYWRNPVGMT